MKKWLRRIGRFIGILFLILSILPYILPVNKQQVDTNKPPFEESRFTKIDEKLWHYRVFEPDTPQKGNIVLIHGFSGSTFSWRNNQQVFADSGYRVIVIDLPAFGFSEKNHNNFDHSPYAHANNIWRLLDTLGYKNESFSLVGHSMGAATTWSMAGLRPDKTSNLFLVDGAGSMGSNQKSGWGSAILVFCLKYPPFLRWIDVIAGAFYFKQAKFKELLNSAYSQTADSVAAAGYLQPFMLKNSGRAVIEGFLYNKTSPKLDYSKLKAPVHLLWGTADKWVPISVAEDFQKKYPLAKMQHIEGAGHCPMETHAIEFNTYVLLSLLKQ